MNVGFIGAGNMGRALINGYTRKNKTDTVYIYDKNPDQSKKIGGTANIKIAEKMSELVKKADIIILAVKPDIFEIVLSEIKKTLITLNDAFDKVFVSIAAGISIAYMKEKLGQEIKIIRAMPNLNSMVAQGMTGISRDDLVDDEVFSAVKALFDSVGKSSEVDEEIMDTVVGISGSSPAYAFMFINALIKCAVKNGMDKDKAVIFASQATLGAAVTVMESGIDPETLIDNVCSPGGTTIEAVKKLDELGFEEIVEEAMTAVIKKSEAMTHK